MLAVIITANVSCNQKIIAQKKVAKQPNVVFILIDDLGWADTSPFGSTFYETPNISKLASEGMKFTNAYAACPVCSPTRASIMSGKYPVTMNTTDWFGAPQPQAIEKNIKNKKNFPLLPASYISHLPLKEETIAEALKTAGYNTFIAGKWHLGEEEKYWPEHQGFDINKGGYFMGHPNLNRKLDYDGYFSPYGNPRLEDGPKGEYLPMRLAAETNHFMEENKDKPFFAYFSMYSVHTPLQASEELIEKYRKKREKLGLTDEVGKEGNVNVRLNQSNITYAAMVEAMDIAVGKVLDKIKELGIEDNTLVVFFSDNGGLSTTEGMPTSNLPLRGGKGWMYEGGIREPMIVRWPKVVEPGSVCATPIISNDFYPTILNALHLPLIPSQHTGGKSILPLLEQKKMENRPLFWHYPHYGNQGGAPASAVRDGHWKLIHWYVEDRYELFNLKDDIGEHNNLVKKNPKETEKLKQELQAWLKSENAILPQKWNN
ncbi:sulfatase [Pedobacter sp. SD-b]|uniref:Sulfatase n=1 Tax=Pedobacter segetis TaxID=2793069 RepID=A0ABS1BL41_9SPHI|nr:sulfatase [Pedobacter segetis]MBK0383612.1 sulfatase [Pedobacter segetis]